MARHNAVLWTHDTHDGAEATIRELERGGFPMQQLSIVGTDYHTEEHVLGYYNLGDRVKVWGRFGAFWGGLWGLLSGSALFLIPGIGPLMVFGPLVAWIVGALEGAVVVGGVSALGAALFGAGIPKDCVLRYESDLRAHKFLVMAHGTVADLAKAQAILANHPSGPGTLHELSGGLMSSAPTVVGDEVGEATV